MSDSLSGIQCHKLPRDHKHVIPISTLWLSTIHIVNRNTFQRHFYLELLACAVRRGSCSLSTEIWTMHAETLLVTTLWLDKTMRNTITDNCPNVTSFCCFYFCAIRVALTRGDTMNLFQQLNYTVRRWFLFYSRVDWRDLASDLRQVLSRFVSWKIWSTKIAWFYLKHSRLCLSKRVESIFVEWKSCVK